LVAAVLVFTQTALPVNSRIKDRSYKLVEVNLPDLIAGTSAFPDRSAGKTLFVIRSRHDSLDVAVGADGSIVISHPEQIYKINTEGKCLPMLARTEFSKGDKFPDFGIPDAVACSPSGEVVIGVGSSLRKLLPDGTTRLLAGNPYLSGRVDGPGDQARFEAIYNFVPLADGSVYVATPHCIRKIDPAGHVSTIAGTTDEGSVDGPAGSARFSYPRILAIREGVLQVIDAGSGSIREVLSDGTVRTFKAAMAKGQTTAAIFKKCRAAAQGKDNTVFLIRGNSIMAWPGTDSARTIAEIGYPIEGDYEPFRIVVDERGNLYITLAYLIL
jgi:hypothetical protein